MEREKKHHIGVVGSRTFIDYDFLRKVINKYLRVKQIDKPIVIVSGGAKGADQLAAKYAIEKNFELVEHKPDWDSYGKSAGFKRNTVIVNYSDVIIAFWDGESRGTKDTISKGKEKGIPVYIFWGN